MKITELKKKDSLATLQVPKGKRRKEIQRILISVLCALLLVGSCVSSLQETWQPKLTTECMTSPQDSRQDTDDRFVKFVYIFEVVTSRDVPERLGTLPKAFQKAS